MKPIKTTLVFLVWLAMAFMGQGCGSQSAQQAQKAGLPTIVCTTGLVADALLQICKDSAQIVALMGVGVDPHLYKASQGDMKKLSEADLIFYNGLHLEGKMSDILEKMRAQDRAFPIADGLASSDLRSLGENLPDPHIWFDAKLWALCVEHAQKILVQKYPQKAAYFTQNAKDYIKTLHILHDSTQKKFERLPREKRVLVTAHDAFGYFGKAYKLEVKSLQGISTVTEPGLRDVTELVNWLIERKVKTIFTETSVSDKGIKAVIDGCKQKKHELRNGGALYTDALGNAESPEGTYAGMFAANVKKIINAAE